MAFCGNCGKQLPDGATICPSCGAPVQGAAPQPQVAPEPQPAQESAAGQQKQGAENGQQTGNFSDQTRQAQQNQNGPQGQYGQENYQQVPFQNQYYQQGPSQASQTINHMGQNMNRLVPKSKSEGLEVACFVMAILSVKFSLSMVGQVYNILGLILGAIPVLLLLINKEKTSNKTVQTLALIIGIVGICLSLLGIILVATHVPEWAAARYLLNKASYLQGLFDNIDY